MRQDVGIIGGGIVGLAVARALSATVSVVVLEAERELASHQTGHNSGVIHAGIYYRPGSLKARLCTAGREAMYRFCQQHALAHERTGKLIVATRPDELETLAKLEERGRANGLAVRRLTREQIAEYEPHAAGMAGLHVPETGIVDYRAVSEAMAVEARSLGADVRTDLRVRAIAVRPDGITLETDTQTLTCARLVNCAGLQSDRVARMAGLEPGLKIVPFRGEYYRLAGERAGLVRGLIYPVPDARFPFLGVHFTRTTHGFVEAGPNAVLALKREGYRWRDVSLADATETLGYAGFWKLASQHWRTGAGEVWRSMNKRAFWRSLRRLVPDLRLEDLLPGGSGVRAQAVEPSGAMVDDFRILAGPRMVHVLNAPSPAATASLAIGDYIANLAAEAMGLRTASTAPPV